MTPFVKWVGGKRQLLKKIEKMLPSKFNKYYEPFVGGGALFFSLSPKKAHINDYNEELINVYKVLSKKSSCNKLLKLLDEHENKHSEEYYYKIRALDREANFSDLSKEFRASRTIYLNKGGYNGLYRVNSKGQFNVPFGKKEKLNTYNLENIMSINDYLVNNDIRITNGDFTKVELKASKNDFIYFDPPYDKWDKKDSFTTYTKNDFSREDQKRLFNTFEKLSKKGAYVMLSNHNTEFINDLYKEFYITVVKARRMVNSNANGRGAVEEVIITNYPVDIGDIDV